MRRVINFFQGYDPRGGLEPWEPPGDVHASGQALVNEVRDLVEGSLQATSDGSPASNMLSPNSGLHVLDRIGCKGSPLPPYRRQ